MKLATLSTRKLLVTALAALAMAVAVFLATGLANLASTSAGGAWHKGGGSSDAGGAWHKKEGVTLAGGAWHKGGGGTSNGGAWH